MVVKLTYYDKKKCVTTRHNALKKEVVEHGLGEVILSLRNKYMTAYTGRGKLKSDIRYLKECHKNGEM